VISHPRLPPGWTVKISSTRNSPFFVMPLCRSSYSCFSCHDPTNTCPEPNDSEESEELEDEGMDEGANIDGPGGNSRLPLTRTRVFTHPCPIPNTIGLAPFSTNHNKQLEHQHHIVSSSGSFSIPSLPQPIWSNWHLRRHSIEVC